jgi:gliding motility-associated-like protein
VVNGVDVGTNNALYVTDSLRDGDTVQCLMTAVGSCRAPVGSNMLGMTVQPSPTVVVRPRDTVIAFGKSVGLVSVVAGPAVSYIWTPSVGLSNSGVADPVASPEVTATYRLTVSAVTGCSASDTAHIAVVRPLVLPNAFTPNGDGRNDVFRIPPGVGVALIRLAVYNRDGGRVFVTANVSQGWDGTVAGARQPAGLYVWTIDYIDLLARGRVQTSGTVMLIR